MEMKMEMETNPIPCSASEKWMALDDQEMMLLELNLSEHHEEEEEEEDRKLVAYQEQSSTTSISSVEVLVAEWDGRPGSTANASLLRALQLSQIRAREAEKKAMAESDRSQELSRLLLEDALRLSAYRRWATLLEAENSILRLKGIATGRPQEEEEEEEAEAKEEDEPEDDAKAKKKATAAPMAGWLALASCVGIAGVGFVVARSVHYSIQQPENSDRGKPSFVPKHVVARTYMESASSVFPLTFSCPL